MAFSVDAFGRFRDLQVGRKLLLAFTAVSLVLLIVLVGLFATVARLQDADHTVTNVVGSRVASAVDVRFSASQLRATQQAYLLDNGRSRADYVAATVAFEETLREMQDRVAGPAQVALAEKISTGYQTFLTLDQIIWDSVQSGEVTKARNLALGAEALDFGFISADATSLADLARAQQAEAAVSFDRTVSRARLGAIALGLLALILVIALSVLITRAIRDPLQRVQEAAERAAAGDLDAEVGIVTEDETGRLARAFDAMLANLRSRENLLYIDHRRQELDGQVHRALEMADDEPSAIEVVGRTLEEILPGRAAELLLADSSKAHLVQAVVAGPEPAGPECGVESPFACTAVRNGHTMTFETSTALDACPKLRDRKVGACSAVCVPITFMGRAMGVLHAIGPDGDRPDEEEIGGLEMLSTQAGARIGMLRSISRTQLQATTDGLTGMLNRRSFETRVRAMHREGLPFTLVMADLDHFKQLNDTYGHEAGDRALRLFAEVVKAATRTEDLVSRFGGEEFLIALPRASSAQAVDMADRLRVVLAGRVAGGDAPPFTASFGVAESTCATQLEGVLKAADVALYRAKTDGRDRVVVHDAGTALSEESRPYLDNNDNTNDESDNGYSPALTSISALADNDDPLDP